MNSGIYKIANKITNDFYIGSAVNLYSRLSTHKANLKNQKHPNNYLQNVFNKYGLDNLFFEIIETVKDKNELIEREQFYIDTLNPEYNIRKIANSNLGLKHSRETKLKMSKANKGNKSRLGHKNSEKHKLKMSEFMKGNKYNLGHKHAEETKIKIAKSLSKPFKLLSPHGQVIEGINLRKFCRENDLHSGNMCDIINNKLKSYKGWTKYE